VIGLASAVVLAMVVVTAGCSANSNGEGAGAAGGSSSSGGAAGTGGQGGHPGVTEPDAGAGAAATCFCTCACRYTDGSARFTSLGFYRIPETECNGEGCLAAQQEFGECSGRDVEAIVGSECVETPSGSFVANVCELTTCGEPTGLGALTGEEAAQLCDETYSYFGSAIPQATACRWRGLAYATSSSFSSEEQLRQNCTNEEARCLDADSSAVWPNPGCSEIPSSCAATEADYHACISDQVASFNQVVSGLPSCDKLTLAGTAAIWEAQTSLTPENVCMSLQTACPGLSPPSPLN
jgi:hypothetical protein